MKENESFAFKTCTLSKVISWATSYRNYSYDIVYPRTVILNVAMHATALTSRKCSSWLLYFCLLPVTHLSVARDVVVFSLPVNAFSEPACWFDLWILLVDLLVFYNLAFLVQIQRLQAALIFTTLLFRFLPSPDVSGTSCDPHQKSKNTGIGKRSPEIHCYPTHQSCPIPSSTNPTKGRTPHDPRKSQLTIRTVCGIMECSWLVDGLCLHFKILYGMTACISVGSCFGVGVGYVGRSGGTLRVYAGSW